MSKKELPKKHLVAKRSSAGLGLFTTEPIKKNEFIIEYKGKLLDNDAADRKGGKYLFEIDDDWVIDGTSRKNLARYINHSCRPNCEVEVATDDRRAFVYSIKNIEAGEELTYDYGKEYFIDLLEPDGCKCTPCQEKKKKKRKKKRR